jgi:hypothetical protein
MPIARAWAVVEGGGDIIVESVSPTRRAAIVNWLFVRKQTLVTVAHSDIDIERSWVIHRGSAVVMQVGIVAWEERLSATGAGTAPRAASP